MNRIYQGRVTQVEIPDLEEKGKWLLFHHNLKDARDLTKQIPELRQKVQPEIEERAGLFKEQRKGHEKSKELQKYERLRDEQRKEWHLALVQHHELFQTAVNYFFAAFAAMVPDDCKEWQWSDYRAAVVRSWRQHNGKKGRWAEPFAEVCKLVCGARDVSFGQFRAKLFQLTQTASTEKQRFAALKQLFADAGTAIAEITSPTATTEGALSGGSKDVFGKRLVKLCSAVTDAANEVEEAEQRKKAGKLVEKIASNRRAKLGWDDVFAFRTTRAKESWTAKQARQAIKKHARQLARAYVAKGEISRPFLREYCTFRRNLRAAKLSTTKPVRTGAGGDDLKAAILFHLHPCSEFRDMFLKFATHRRGDEDIEVPKSDACDAARNAGDKPLPVFPFFVDLRIEKVGDVSVGQGAWPEFEKAAFAEVFVKIGQFLITGKKFEMGLRQARATIALVEADLLSDARLQAIEEIVSDLGGLNVDSAGLPLPYTIRDRTLAGWQTLREKWREMLKCGHGPRPTKDELLKAKKALEKHRRQKFGSAPVFERLADPNYHHIWSDNDGADPLERWADYQNALEDRDHFESDRTFTPAHAIYSPRYFRWSETKNHTHLPWQGIDPIIDKPKPFLVEVDGFDFERRIVTQYRLHYSAPRLLRNRLRQKDEKLDGKSPDLEALAPPLAALIAELRTKGQVFEVNKQSFDGTSVRLAPRLQEDGAVRDIQLVFEHEFETRTTAASWRTLFPFAERRERPAKDRDEIPCGLAWNGPAAETWKARDFVQCLPVDLGLNHSAAWRVLRIERHFSNSDPARGITHALTANGDWVVRSVAAALVRLSGEERWVYRTNSVHDLKSSSRKLRRVLKELKIGKSKAFLPELSGMSGRKADSTAADGEMAWAQHWFDAMKSLGDNFEDRVPAGVGSLSFPEQNDQILHSLQQIRKQLFRLNRLVENLYADGQRLTGDPVRDGRITERRQRQKTGAFEEISKLKNNDPLGSLRNRSDEDRRGVMQEMIRARLQTLTVVLPELSDRILPMRSGHWIWKRREESEWHSMELDETRPRLKAMLAGQRGLSNQRLRQLKELRQMAQSLNHLCRHKFAERYCAGPREEIPEPFEQCRQTLEDAREDRVKQIAHEIFVAALGVTLDAPPPDKAKRRENESLHGVYRVLERGPCHVIVLEDLEAYKTSDRRTRRENRQISEWRHRDVHRVLKELCALVGLPIVYVNPRFTSRFSGKDHSVGFRAEEVFADDPRIPGWKRKIEEEDDEELRLFVQQLEAIGTAVGASNLVAASRRPKRPSLLRVRRGGSVFVSLGPFDENRPDAGLYQADLSSTARIGLRAIAPVSGSDRFNSERPELFGIVQLGKRSSKKTRAKTNSARKTAGYVVDLHSVFEKSKMRDGCSHPTIRDTAEFWDAVEGEHAATRCAQINAARLRRWNIQVPETPAPPSPADEDDQIPMEFAPQSKIE